MLRSQEQGKRALVHLINFTGEMTRPIRNVVPVRDLAITLPGSYRSAHTLYDPKPLTVAKATGGSGTRVVLPRLAEYEVVVLEK